MAGGAGFVSDMIKSIRNNKNLKSNSYYKSERTHHESEQLVDPIHASEDTLKEIRAKVLAERKIENRKIVIGLLLSVLVIIMLISIAAFLF
jgi:hypothetical protein